MRTVHRTDCDDQCNGDWCDDPCHQEGEPMREYRCSGCGVTNRAVNDLTGLEHTMTGGKPSNCEGTYQPSLSPPDGEEPDLTAEYERTRRARLEGATEGGEAIEQP